MELSRSAGLLKIVSSCYLQGVLEEGRQVQLQLQHAWGCSKYIAKNVRRQNTSRSERCIGPRFLEMGNMILLLTYF